LIREEIQTTYKQDLQSVYDQLQIQRGQLEKRELFAHPRYVAPLLEYIVTDFERSRRLWEDATVVLKLGPLQSLVAAYLRQINLKE